MKKKVSTKGRNVSLVKVRPKKFSPKLLRVEPEADWVEVTIRLSAGQKAELKALGVDASNLRVTTFDVKRIGAPMIN